MELRGTSRPVKASKNGRMQMPDTRLILTGGSVGTERSCRSQRGPRKSGNMGMPERTVMRLTSPTRSPREATRYIREQAVRQSAHENAEPFLLYLSHFSQHGPLQAPEQNIAYFESKPTRGWNGHSNATYAAMLKHLDASVGALLQALEETGLDEHTLVVFLYDNGGVNWPLGRSRQAATSNAPLKGGKATLFEGGVRVPFVFYWKGHI